MPSLADMIAASRDAPADGFGIYAKEGCGKTMLAASAPNPFFFSSEGKSYFEDYGADGIVVRRWEDALQARDLLIDSPNDYRSMIFDTFRDFGIMCEQHMCKQKGWSGSDDKACGFGKYWNEYQARMSAFLKPLYKFEFLIALCHEVTREGQIETRPLDRDGNPKTKKNKRTGAPEPIVYVRPDGRPVTKPDIPNTIRKAVRGHFGCWWQLYREPDGRHALRFTELIDPPRTIFAKTRGRVMPSPVMDITDKTWADVMEVYNSAPRIRDIRSEDPLDVERQTGILDLVMDVVAARGEDPGDRMATAVMWAGKVVRRDLTSLEELSRSEAGNVERKLRAALAKATAQKEETT